MTDLIKILHVEDEDDIREVAQLALEAIGGFTLKSCSSGEQALKEAPQFKPDLLLLDVMMPRMGGPETLLHLRKIPETSQTPVIFMTAKIQASEVEGYKDLGALEVIAKPFDPMTLSDQIREAWKKR